MVNSMTKNKEKHPYYDPAPLLSRNGTYNFVVGGRGIGKTFAFKRKAIRDYLKHGHEFIVLRRYSTEQGSRHAFFDDMLRFFPKYDFRVFGMYGQISHVDFRDEKKRPWQTICYFASLSTAQQKKSTPYPNVHTIIFDEFIIEKGNMVYLKDEFTAFNNFYSTVDRYQDRVKVFFLANSVSIMNPYFLELELIPEEGKEFYTRSDGFVVAQFPDNDEFSASVYQTRFGKFIENTEYAKYAVENEFEDNEPTMLAIKDSRAKYVFTLETRTGVFSVWYSLSRATFFVQTKRPRKEIFYTLEPDKMSEEKLLLLRNEKLLQTVKTAFRQGRMMFDKTTTRNAFIEIFRR